MLWQLVASHFTVKSTVIFYSAGRTKVVNWLDREGKPKQCPDAKEKVYQPAWIQKCKGEPLLPIHLLKVQYGHFRAGYSKLTMSLVNVSLIFQTWISNICQYFLLEKKTWEAHFLNKNISVFGYKAIKHLTSWPLLKLVSLTMLWTTEPRSAFQFNMFNQDTDDT